MFIIIENIMNQFFEIQMRHYLYREQKVEREKKPSTVEQIEPKKKKILANAKKEKGQNRDVFSSLLLIHFIILYLFVFQTKIRWNFEKE